MLCCYLWRWRWPRRPKSEAHTLLQMWQHGPLGDVVQFACLHIWHSSATWLNFDMPSPSLQLLCHVALSAARVSSWSAGMWYFFNMTFTWSEKRFFQPACEHDCGEFYHTVLCVAGSWMSLEWHGRISTIASAGSCTPWNCWMFCGRSLHVSLCATRGGQESLADSECGRLQGL